MKITERIETTGVLKLNQSHEWFLEALLVLMKKKNFSDITIKELSFKAGLDRRTFYRYFTSKEDLLELQCRRILEEFARRVLEKPQLTFEAVAVSYFEFWNDYSDFLLLLQKNNLVYFLVEKLDKLIYEHVALKAKPYLNGQKLSNKRRYHFFYGMGGLWNVMNWWLLEEHRETPEQMGKIIQDYIVEIHAGLPAIPLAEETARAAQNPGTKDAP